MQQVWFLLGFATAAARATVLADVWEAEATGASPVARVVKLLNDMQARLEADAKADGDLQDKLACFCENNMGQKTAAVEHAKAELEQLASEIESRAAQNEVLKSEIAAQVEDGRKMRESLEAAEAQRVKEAAANHQEILGLTTNLESMKSAIMVLTRHHATMFPQMTKHVKALLQEGVDHTKKDVNPKDMDALDAWMANKGYGQLDAQTIANVDAHVSSALQRDRPKPVARNAEGYTDKEVTLLSHAQKVMQNFVQTGNQEYIPVGGGEIIGILKQMQESFGKQLTELEATDKEQAQQFADMKDSASKAIKESEKMLESKTQKAADNMQARADAIDNEEALRATLSADEEFLVDLEKNCGNREKDFAARKKSRTLEIQAVSEAIGILTQDDNRELMSKTVRKMALTQEAPHNQTAAKNVTATAVKGSAKVLLQMGSRTHRMTARARATAALQTGRPSVWLQLAASRIGVARDGFVRVRAAIERMVTALKDQQKQEVEHKSWCNDGLHTNDMDTLEGERVQSLAQAESETTKTTLAELTDALTATRKEVQDLMVNIQRANVDRVKQNQEFQKTVEEQRATQTVLQRAVEKLSAFYDHQAVLLQAHKVAEAKEAEAHAAALLQEKKKAADAVAAGKKQALLQSNKKHEAEVAAAVPLVLKHDWRHPLTRQEMGLALIQTETHEDPPSELAGGLGEYKKDAGGGSAMTMIKSLITDAKQIEAEAISAEQDAHDAYTSFVSDANKSHEALNRAIVSATERRAETEIAMAQLKEDIAAQAGDLEDLAGKKGAMHEACDFVLDNFDARQTARQEEISALQQASAILVGAA